MNIWKWPTALLALALAACAPTQTQTTSKPPSFLVTGDKWVLTATKANAEAGNKTTTETTNLVVGEVEQVGENLEHLKSYRPSNSTTRADTFFYTLDADGKELLTAGTMADFSPGFLVSQCFIVNPSKNPKGPFAGLYYSGFVDDSAPPKVVSEYLKTGKLPQGATGCTLTRNP